MDLEEPSIATLKDVLSDRSSKDDQNQDELDKEGKSKEEEALDESGSEVEQTRPKKSQSKKAGHGQLWTAILSVQRKDLPGEWVNSKRKAGVQEEL